MTQSVAVNVAAQPLTAPDHSAQVDHEQSGEARQRGVSALFGALRERRAVSPESITYASPCVFRENWRMPTSDRVLGAGAWLLETSHRTLLALTGGRFPRTIAGMRTVEIHVKGRKSGKLFSNMLTTPIREKDWFVIVASKGGSQDHPDWYKNLVANPDIEVTMDGETIRMRARTATGDERAELWQRVASKYKNYVGYQRNTDREIPVVVCEPRS